MFGFGNFDFTKSIKTNTETKCNFCDIYHKESFKKLYTCVCECHAEKNVKADTKEVSLDLDWDDKEEITKTYGT